MSNVNLKSVFDAVIDIKDNIGELKQRTSSLETKLEMVHEQVKKTNGSIEKHDERLDCLDQENYLKKGLKKEEEKERNKVAAFISLVVSAVISIIGIFLKNN